MWKIFTGYGFVQFGVVIVSQLVILSVGHGGTDAHVVRERRLRHWSVRDDGRLWMHTELQVVGHGRVEWRCNFCHYSSSGSVTIRGSHRCRHHIIVGCYCRNSRRRGRTPARDTTTSSSARMWDKACLCQHRALRIGHQVTLSSSVHVMVLNCAHGRRLIENGGRCQSCSFPLTFDTVIRWHAARSCHLIHSTTLKRNEN